MTSSLRAAEDQRRLSNRLISGYEPVSEVLDHAKIDLDQQQIEIQLKLGSEDNFEIAKNIYRDGGHSKSIARVTVAAPGIPFGIKKDANVVGKTAGGGDTHGYLTQDYRAEATTIDIQMDPGYDCNVGGLPNPVFTECFAPNGTINIDGLSGYYPYDYVPLSAGAITNGKTIQRFSTRAAEKMLNCGDQCPYKTFDKFFSYYGRADYADHWIMSAFDSKLTFFATGNADFSRYQKPGRAVAIKTATAYMSIWMNVLKNLEEAIDNCNTFIDGETGIHNWDKGVAYYSGTLEGEDGDGSGVLLSELADRRARNFKTAGDLANEVTGRSHVNIEVFRQFSTGKNHLKVRKCDAVRRSKERIEELMTIPLIQGTLRYAWKTDYDSTLVGVDEAMEAEGATFAASVLPIVAACDDAAADIIYQNMRVGQDNTANFPEVKKAFESVYECMGVRCEDVGGLWDNGFKGYIKNAEPCTGLAPLGAVQPAGKGDGISGIMLVIIIILGSVVGVMLIAMGTCMIRRRSKKGSQSPTIEHVNGDFT